MRSILSLLCMVALVVPAVAHGQGARKSVEGGSQAWEAAWNRGDADGVAALYLENAVVLPPGAEPMRGRAAIRAFWQAAIQSSAGSRSELTTDEVEDLGDVAVEIGSYVNTGPDGEHLDHGKYMVVWKRVDGRWRIARDIFNSSMVQ